MTQPLRYAINVTRDGCVHHEAGLPAHAEAMAFSTDELLRSGTFAAGGAVTAAGLAAAADPLCAHGLDRPETRRTVVLPR